MFDTESSYTSQFLGKKERFEPYLTHISEFRFKAKHRTYFVRVEHLSVGIAAIKYCDVKDKNAHNAYKKIFNDHDGAKVIASCIRIMHNMWKSDTNSSFGFYAVPRDIDINSVHTKRCAAMSNEEYLEKYIRARFNIYEHAMINLFPPSSFWHIQDYKNSMYILLNKKIRSPKKKLEKLVEILYKNHNVIFEPSEKIGGAGSRRNDVIRIG